MDPAHPKRAGRYRLPTEILLRIIDFYVPPCAFETSYELQPFGANLPHIKVKIPKYTDHVADVTRLLEAFPQYAPYVLELTELRMTHDVITWKQNYQQHRSELELRASDADIELSATDRECLRATYNIAARCAETMRSHMRSIAIIALGREACWRLLTQDSYDPNLAARCLAHIPFRLQKR